jgi:hypothetical protein
MTVFKLSAEHRQLLREQNRHLKRIADILAALVPPRPATDADCICVEGTCFANCDAHKESKDVKR